MTFPERVLLFGAEGVGKTRSYWDIAKRHPQNKVKVLDWDHGCQYFAPSFSDIRNLEYVTPETYREMMTVLGKWQLGDGDWLVLDNMGEAKFATQGHVTSEGHDKDLADWVTEGLKSKGDYGKTSNAINLSWHAVIQRLVNTRAHVMLCAPSEPTWETEKDERYARLGYKPAGFPTNRFAMRSIVYLNMVGDRRIITTVKDIPGRGLVTNKKIDNLVDGYLREVAGWSI